MSPAAERLATELRVLYEAAGKPTLESLMNHAANHKPPVQLRVSTLGDWLAGTSVPRTAGPFTFMITYLQQRAAGRPQAGYRARPMESWGKLLASAQAEKRANRGGRPRSPGPETGVNGPPLGPVVGAATETAIPAGLDSERIGRPVRSCSASSLEVRRSIDAPDHQPGTASAHTLTSYFPRLHDRRLSGLVADVVATGRSRLVTVVGNASAGKTRTCWETLWDLPEDWNVWHPLAPSRPRALATGLPLVGGRTVVWLNEARHYLAPDAPALAEEIAAGLRTLLDDSGRGPVLIIATLWKEHWHRLTCRPGADEPDPYAQTRELLSSGIRVDVPETFTTAELAMLKETTDDSRLRAAALRATDGRVVQYLAGGPLLLDRYLTVSPPARALIDAAVDAVRVGHSSALPIHLLVRAVDGYLDSHDRNELDGDWQERSVQEVTEPCAGVPGPLAKIRLGTGAPRYRLADFLEQHRRAERAHVFPPASLWNALAEQVSDPADLARYGHYAELRCHFRRALTLYRRAVERAGPAHTAPLGDLVRLQIRTGDLGGAETLARTAAERGEMAPLRVLARTLLQSGDSDGARRIAAAAEQLGDDTAFRELAKEHLRRREVRRAVELFGLALDAGDQNALDDMMEMATNGPALDGTDELLRLVADRGDTRGLLAVADRRVRFGDLRAGDELYRQAADRGEHTARQALARLREKAGDYAGAALVWNEGIDAGDLLCLLGLVRLRERQRRHVEADRLACQAADSGDTGGLRLLALARDEERLMSADERERAREAGQDQRFYLDRGGRTFPKRVPEELVRRAAEAGDAEATTLLGRLRERYGLLAEAETLYREAVRLGDEEAWHDLALLLSRRGEIGEASRIAERLAAKDDPSMLVDLANILEGQGEHDRAEEMARKAAELGDTRAVGSLARQRDQRGDHHGAAALACAAVDLGDTSALRALIVARLDRDDLDSAEELAWKVAQEGDFGPVREIARRLESNSKLARGTARRGGYRRWRAMQRSLVMPTAQLDEDEATELIDQSESLERRAGAQLEHRAKRLYRQAANLGDLVSLGDLSRLAERGGEPDHATALALEAARGGSTGALRTLAGGREKSDRESAAALYRQAAECGDSGALEMLIRLSREDGDHRTALHMKRFGLDP